LGRSGLPGMSWLLSGGLTGFEKCNHRSHRYFPCDVPACTRHVRVRGRNSCPGRFRGNRPLSRPSIRAIAVTRSGFGSVGRRRACARWLMKIWIDSVLEEARKRRPRIRFMRSNGAPCADSSERTSTEILKMTYLPHAFARKPLYAALAAASLSLGGLGIPAAALAAQTATPVATATPPPAQTSGGAQSSDDTAAKTADKKKSDKNGKPILLPG